MIRPVETLSAADPARWTPDVVKAAGWIYDEVVRWIDAEVAEQTQFALAVAALTMAADVTPAHVLGRVEAHRDLVARLTDERFGAR